MKVDKIEEKQTKSKKNFKFNIRHIYFLVILLIISLHIIKNSVDLWVGILAIVILILFEYVSLVINKNREAKDLKEYIEDLNIITKNTIVNSPIPLLIAETDGQILWKSDKFKNAFDDRISLNKIENLIYDIKEEIEETEDKLDIEKEIVIKGGNYKVYCQYTRGKRRDLKKQKEYVLTLQFIDVTNEESLKKELEEKKIVFGIIQIDNYSEIIDKLSAAEKPRILSEIEKEIYEWAEDLKAVAIKVSTQEFYILFEKEKLEFLKLDKFSILEKIKNIRNDENLVTTISIAIASDGKSLIDTFISTKELMEVVLGRGGDQAGILEDKEYRFFGGRTKEIEKLNEVKARIISKQITDRAKLASNIIIMGHTNIDIDALRFSYRVTSINK